MARGISRTELEAALAKWQQAEVISADQAGKIREMETTVTDVLPREPAQVLTWLGGFLALIASAVFIGVDWNNMGATQQTMWAVLGIGVLWGIAWALRRKDDLLRIQASNLLVIVGTLLIMLLAYTLYRLTGVWPDHPDWQSSQRTTTKLMGIAQAATAVVAVFWAFRLRASWMLLPAGSIGWMAWMAGTDSIRPRGNVETENEVLLLAAYGIVLVIAGLVVLKLGWKHHATWLFAVGLTINLIMLGVRSAENPLGLNGTIFLVLTVIAIVLGIMTDQRIFLLFGAVGLYGWLSALVIETFGGSRPVAFALILVGVAIVVAGGAWQRFHVPNDMAHSH